MILVMAWRSCSGFGHNDVSDIDYGIWVDCCMCTFLCCSSNLKIGEVIEA